MRGGACPVSEISVFASEISVTEMKIFPDEHYSPGNREETFWQNSRLRFCNIAAKIA